MTRVSARSQPHRLALGARVFGVLLLTVPLLWTRDTTASLALLAVALIWVTATAVERLPFRPVLASGIEGALVGTVCALSLDSSLAVLGALAVPPFTSALRRGLRGMLVALSAELVALVVLATFLRGPMHSAEGSGTFTWVLMGLGLGLIGSFVHSALHTPVDPLTPYRDAQALIRGLLDLSGRLSSGLDPFTLGQAVAETVRDELPVTALLVSVPHGEALSPLVTEAETEDADELEALALEASDGVHPVQAGRTFAFPLMTDVGLVAVVAGRLPEGTQLDIRFDVLSERLQPAAVHLDTALLFTAFRDAATSNERRRLAREMHDGIAQDIASLGYLVDAIAAQPASPQQAAQLQVLRQRLTTVVGEVRRSVQTLRTEIGASESLGGAIAGLARHLSDSSGIPIHVTTDERPTRLRPEVEAELLRIAQEALTNAVRHAGATRIDVTCRVRPPEAEIVVRDDGHGLGPPRLDSHGIDIMHERARLAGGELTILPGPPRGTVVTVRVPSGASRPHGTTPGDRVTA